jgi:hypothetical protein
MLDLLEGEGNRPKEKKGEGLAVVTGFSYISLWLASFMGQYGVYYRM